VTLIDNAIDTLGKSQEFNHDHDILGLHHGYDESYRQEGGPPGLQFSYKSTDKTQGDIDIDYRSINPFKGEVIPNITTRTFDNWVRRKRSTTTSDTLIDGPGCTDGGNRRRGKTAFTKRRNRRLKLSC
jgi:hypothetical protein